MNNEEFMQRVLKELGDIKNDISDIKAHQLSFETETKERLGNIENDISSIKVHQANFENELVSFSLREVMRDKDIKSIKSYQVKMERDVSVIRKETEITRKLVDESFRDILMLDNRTESLKKAK